MAAVPNTAECPPDSTTTNSTTSPNAPTLATVLRPPNPLPVPLPANRPSVFLAGSIDMGTALEWQKRLISTLLPYPLTILNPRRHDPGVWTMGQSLDNPVFVEQVEWELDGMERADVIAMYFWPGGKAPVSLLELGLAARARGSVEGGEARRKKMVVCCPEGFWRRGNVQLVCRRFGILCVDTLEELEEEVVRLLGFGEEGEGLADSLLMEDGVLVEGNWDD